MVSGAFVAAKLGQGRHRFIFAFNLFVCLLQMLFFCFSLLYFVITPNTPSNEHFA